MQLHLVKLHLGALALKVSRGSPHLKPHLQKKTKCALSTLGVIFLIYLTNYLITEKSHLRLCAARAQASRAPLPMPSMAHSSLPQGTQSATPCHPMPPLQPSSAFSLRGSSQVGLRSSRATSPTRLTQQHQLRSRRAFFAFVCAGIASTGATVHQRGLFARENATLRAAVSSLYL